MKVTYTNHKIPHYSCNYSNTNKECSRERLEPPAKDKKKKKKKKKKEKKKNYWRALK